MNNLATPRSLHINRTKFLIVDDLPARSELVERYLLLSSARQVRKASAPLAALRIMQDARTQVDCVLCAHEFKPMSGLEFLQNIRAGRYGSRSIAEIKFILMLRQRDEHVIQAATSVGVNGHIIGAFDRDSLTGLITQALKEQPTTPSKADAPGSLFLSDVSKGAVIKLAHIRVQGTDLIIVPFEQSFGEKSPQEQQHAFNALRENVDRARLQGELVPVWETRIGGMAFLAPQGLHPYFQSISFDFVRANLNRELRI
jgi:CheY-like chemotaxis protein